MPIDTVDTIDTLDAIDAPETGATRSNPASVSPGAGAPETVAGADTARTAAAGAATLEVQQIADAAAAGDWGLFQRRCVYIDTNPGIDSAAAIALKRRFGLAYLGARAQLQGGVYMRARPSVFTPAFVERMAAENAGRRYKRYPWLEKLIQLQQQLDQDQYRVAAQESTILAGARRHLHVVPSTNSHL